MRQRSSRRRRTSRRTSWPAVRQRSFRRRRTPRRTLLARNAPTELSTSTDVLTDSLAARRRSSRRRRISRRTPPQHANGALDVDGRPDRPPWCAMRRWSSRRRRALRLSMRVPDVDGRPAESPRLAMRQCRTSWPAVRQWISRRRRQPYIILRMTCMCIQAGVWGARSPPPALYHFTKDMHVHTSGIHAGVLGGRSPSSPISFMNDMHVHTSRGSGGAQPPQP